MSKTVPNLISNLTSDVRSNAVSKISTTIARLTGRRTTDGSRLRSQAGQATAEYGLVILAAAALAGVLLAWATGNGGVDRLMNAVMDSIIGDVTGR